MANNKKLGLPGGPNEYVTHVSDLFSTEGYKRNSPDVNNPFNIIPSGNITMEGVDFPVMGTDNLGNSQMMTPGNNYEFPGDQVFEVPIAQAGGSMKYINEDGELERYTYPSSVFKDEEGNPSQTVMLDPVVINAKGPIALAKEQIKKYGITDTLKQSYVKDRSEKAYNNIVPQGYGNIKTNLDRYRRFKGNLGRDPEALWYDGSKDNKTYYTIPNREDAFRLYLGMPQINNSFSVSDYRPGESEDKSMVYLKPTYFQNPEIKQALIDSYFSGGKEDQGKRRLGNERGLPRGEWQGDGTQFPDADNSLGDFTFDIGEDENGSYISIYDIWDLNPFHSKGKGSSVNKTGKALLDMFNKTSGKKATSESEVSEIFGAGKPFEIYDRIYFDPETKKIKELKKGGSVTGGGLLDKTMKCNSCGWEWKAADGGADVSTCHKCGSSALPKAQFGLPDWLSSGADYVMDTVNNVADSVENGYNVVVDNAEDILTDVKTSLNPYNFSQTKKGDNPLNAFLSGNFKKIPTYEGANKDEAFKKARKKLGSGQEFLYDGVRYGTDFKGETTHKGTNNFFNRMNKGIKKGQITNEQFERFKEIWIELGQPKLEVGEDKYDNILTGKSWAELGLNKSDHVNPFTGSVFIARPSFNAKNYMEQVLNEFTHVKQQNDVGRVDYTLQYLKDLAGSGIEEVNNFINETKLNLDNEKGIKFGSFNPKKIQKNLYNTPGTLENHAHKSDNNLKDSYINYVIDGQKLRYGGDLPKAQKGIKKEFPKFNLSNQKLNLDERANNLTVQDAISSSQSLRVIPELPEDNYSVTGKQRLQPQTGNDMVSAYNEPDTYDKVTDILASPLTSLSYFLSGQDIPDSLPLGMENRNPHDALLDMFNPFAMAKYAVQSNQSFENAGPLSFNSSTGKIDGLGEYVNAGLEGLGAIPVVPTWLKYGKYAKDINKLPSYVSKPIINNARKNLTQFINDPIRMNNPFGFQRIGDTQPLSDLSLLTPENIDLTKGFGNYAEELSKQQRAYGIKHTDQNLSENYFKGKARVRDQLNENITPFGKSLGSGMEGTVYEFANYPESVLKYARNYSPNRSDINLPLEAMSFRNKATAIPLKAQKIFDKFNNTEGAISLMDNLNKVGLDSPLQLSKRDAYADLLKRVRKMRDAGIQIDAINTSNIRFNKVKGIYDIYDLERGKGNPNYMKWIDQQLRTGQIIPDKGSPFDFMYGGSLPKAQPGREIFKQGAKQIAKHSDEIISALKGFLKNADEPIYRGVYLNDEIRNLAKFTGKTDDEILEIMGTQIPGNTGTIRKRQFNQTLNFGRDFDQAAEHIRKFTNPNSIYTIGNTDDLLNGQKYVLKVKPNSDLNFISAEQQNNLYRETIEKFKTGNPNGGFSVPTHAKDFNYQSYYDAGYARPLGLDIPIRSEGINVLDGNFPQFFGNEGDVIGRLLKSMPIKKTGGSLPQAQNAGEDVQVGTDTPIGPYKWDSETGVDLGIFKESSKGRGQRIANIAMAMAANGEDGGRPPASFDSIESAGGFKRYLTDAFNSSIDEDGLCRDNTCVQTVKDFYRNSGIDAIPEDVYNNREFLKNFKEYGFVEILDHKNIQPGDAIQYYYGPDSEGIDVNQDLLNFPYHIGLNVSPGKYIGDGSSDAPIQIQDMYIGTSDEKGEYKKDPFRAFRYIKQNKEGGSLPKAQAGIKKEFPKFNLSNQNLNLDERANNLTIQDNIPSPQLLRVIPKNITKNLVESADTESQQEDVQNAQQNVQNKAVIFVESPTYDTHPYDINESIYDSEGNLIANYPPKLETLYNNFNQSQTNIEDIKNKKIAEKKANGYLQFLIHEKDKMKKQHDAMYKEFEENGYYEGLENKSRLVEFHEKYQTLGNQIGEFTEQIYNRDREIDKRYDSQLLPLYKTGDNAFNDFYNSEFNSAITSMDSTFYKEAQNLQSVYERLHPDTNVEIVPTYDNPDIMREKVADLNKNDAMFMFGHSGGMLGGIPNTEIADIFQESKAENCYLGSCDFEDEVGPYTNMVNKNVNYRPSGAWWGVNPNGSTIDEAMWSRVTDPTTGNMDPTVKRTAKIITPTLGVDYQTKKLKKGGGIEKYTMYKDYVNGIYTGDKKESIAQKNYDRLNRLHYREAKTNQMTPANYILSYLME